MKRINLLLPTYNGESYLPALLDSLKNQSYPALRIYARDDGSQDGTVAILRRFRQTLTGGKELVLVNDIDQDWSNQGPHQNFHHILRSMEQADYYFFCDQDDVWDPHKIERAVSLMEKCPADVPLLYTHNYYVCDGELRIQHTLSKQNKCIRPKQMARIELAKVIMTGTWAGVGMAQGFNHTLKKLAFDRGSVTPSIAVDCWVSWVVAGMNGILIYDARPLARYRRHHTTFSAGGADGLARYLDWQKHKDRHCQNIVNGIADYRRLYRDLVSPSRAAFLDLYAGKKRIRKLFYPHRLRDRLLEEIAFRILILIGKI